MRLAKLWTDVGSLRCESDTEYFYMKAMKVITFICLMDIEMLVTRTPSTFSLDALSEMACLSTQFSLRRLGDDSNGK